MWLCSLFCFYTSHSTDQGVDLTREENAAAKVLLFPTGHGYSSHIMDFQRLARLLMSRGYGVGVLINDEDQQYMQHEGRVRTHSYPCTSGGEERLRLTDARFRELMLTQTNTSVTELIRLLGDQQLQLCEQLLRSSSVLDQVAAEHYDLIIVDYADSCSRVVTQYFHSVPTVVYNGVGFSFDSAFFPNLPTIVPTFTSSFPDDMTFWERAENTIRLFLMRLMADHHYFDAFDVLKQKYKMKQGLPSVRKAFAGKVTFAHSSWALDYPRPLLPTVISVGGMHVEEVHPLTPDLDSFVNRTGRRAGIVVVSFGSLIDKVDPRKAELIAAGLAQLEQGVIWRYTGAAPKGLGQNTLLLPWVPQNDLLAHPLTRAFVTHCGIHATYEAMRHAVPVVAIPLFADQFDNANKLVRRTKMGISLDYKHITSMILVEAIRKVIAHQSFKEKAEAASRLLFDGPVSPRELFLFYIDYVVRHKGAGPLASTPVIKLDTFQLYGLDVALFLLSICIIIFVIIIFAMFLTVRFCFHRCRRHRKQKCE